MYCYLWYAEAIDNRIGQLKYQIIKAFWRVSFFLNFERDLRAVDQVNDLAPGPFVS